MGLGLIRSHEQEIGARAQVLLLHLSVPLLCVKVAPGIADSAIPGRAEVEFVSHQGTCKEAVLWCGAGNAPGRRRASVCIEQHWHAIDGQASEQLSVTTAAPGRWLHEPDPALIRAHALGPVAAELSAGLLDATLAYLVGPPGRRSPLVSSFEILVQTPLRREAIQAALDELGWSQLEIKKRGVDLEPEEFRKKLRIRGRNGPGTLVLTRAHGRHTGLLCRRVL